MSTGHVMTCTATLQVDWKRPYIKGLDDPLKTTLEATAFNNRKQSGVFTTCKTNKALVHPQPYTIVSNDALPNGIDVR